jgi:hypothetical protein
MWGSIPLRNFLNPKTLRWTLGASDMMFNASFHFSTFLSHCSLADDARITENRVNGIVGSSGRDR